VRLIQTIVIISYASLVPKPNATRHGCSNSKPKNRRCKYTSQAKTHIPETLSCLHMCYISSFSKRLRLDPLCIILDLPFLFHFGSLPKFCRILRRLCYRSISPLLHIRRSSLHLSRGSLPRIEFTQPKFSIRRIEQTCRQARAKQLDEKCCLWESAEVSLLHS